MINQDVFYKRFGVRAPQQMLAPRLPLLKVFSFPRSALLHYIVMDGVEVGPSSTDYLFRDIDKRIFVEHAQELRSFEGNPRKLSVPLKPFIRDFHIRNKRFRLTEDASVTPTEDNILAVVNYALLSKTNKYVRSLFTEYYRWRNIQVTAWLRVREIASASPRHQFIFASLPKILPSLARLNMAAEKGMSSLNVQFFASQESLFLLEVWKWLDPLNREKSVIGNLTPEQADKVNLVFHDAGHWTMINLGLLQSWIFIKGVSPQDQKVKVSPEEMRKRFLRMMMSLMESRSANSEEGTADPKDVEQDIEGKTQEAREKELLANLDQDLQQLETIETNAVEKELPADGSGPSEAVKKQPALGGAVNVNDFDTLVSAEDRIKDMCDKMAEAGAMTAAEYRRFLKHIENSANVKSPEPGVSLKDYIEIPKEDLLIKEATKIDDIFTVPDKSMLESSLFDFDSKYIKKVLPKDIASMPVAIQKAGVIVTNYEVEEIEDILGKYEMHTVRITPVVGSPSTIRFKIPSVDENGTYTSGGTRYRLRKQRGDLPIRKISPASVSLSSYYGKTFVTRSDKKVSSYSSWLHEQIILRSQGENNTIQNLAPSDVFDGSFVCPRAYSTMAMKFASFSTAGWDFNFDHKQREKIFGPDNLKRYERRGLIFVALNAKDQYLLLDANNTLYLLSGDILQPTGSLEAFLGLDPMSAPVEYAQTSLFGRPIPVGLVLGYLYGLSTLMKMLKVTPRRVFTGQRLNLQEHEYAITFADESLIFSRDDRLAALILSGFQEYDKVTRSYGVYLFDKPDVYLNVIQHGKMNIRHIREMDLIDKLFVDPITQEILEEMKEPLTYRGLLVRASELLLTDQHPHSLDIRAQRIKGYERFAGGVYTELVNAIRDHGARPNKANSQIELSPYAVWKRIVQEDASNAIVEDINPIKSIKEMEAATYNGTGGRSARSMVRAAREYHPNDMGVISEATVDSSDVGINVFTTANPQFSSVRGLTRSLPLNDVPNSSLLSSVGLLGPGTVNDDLKRAGMAAIQSEHVLACNGYQASGVRTGYEQVIAHRTASGFAKMAEQDGVIRSRTEHGLTVEYKDGTVQGFELGRRYGAAGGLTIAHELVSDLQEGAKFKKNDPLLYHPGFFEKDKLNPKSLVWKSGVLARVVLWESRQTHEDASSISKNFAAKLRTKVTKVKTIVVSFDQIVNGLLQPGTPVEPDTVLCTIQDSLTADAKLFDEASLNTLTVLSSRAPKAGVKGILERVEVFYNGDKEDMSENLQALASASDREFAKRRRSQNKPVFTGSVDEGFRVEGEPLLMGNCAIRVYITSDEAAGVGDKGVLSNQMKTVFSEVMTYDLKTESGKEIDIVFGAQSIFNRIVLNPFIIGTSNVLLGLAGKNAAKIYKGE